MVVLGCAHPAKFPEAVTAATGVHPALPERLADLPERPERLVVLPNDLGTVQAFILRHARLGDAQPRGNV
jgi:threonine synthase